MNVNTNTGLQILKEFFGYEVYFKVIIGFFPIVHFLVAYNIIIIFFFLHQPNKDTANSYKTFIQCLNCSLNGLFAS